MRTLKYSSTAVVSSKNEKGVELSFSRHRRGFMCKDDGDSHTEPAFSP